LLLSLRQPNSILFPYTTLFRSKENAEHVMLVDLARNDLSRNADHVVVETYREIQFYSHVIHLVSQVSGEITDDTNLIKVLGETLDRKSTRLNSSHVKISYAVFC